MADNNWRQPSYTATAQVWQGTVGSNTNTHTFTLTVTDDDGETGAVTTTADGVLTTTQLAAALVAAWNASTNPLLTKITASNVGAVVSLTADTAGVPFSVAASGSGTWSGTGNTTENEGPYDYGTARNWQNDAKPAATENVVVGVGTVDLLYSLNQSSVALGDFRVEKGCKSKIGRFENGLPHYLRIDPDLFRCEYSGQRALFDIGSAAISPYIWADGSPELTGRYVVGIKGSAISTLEIAKGSVSIAQFLADTATITTLRIGYDTTQASDANVLIGAGTTLTTLDMAGGVCKALCGFTTGNILAGATLTTEGSGTITTLNAYGTVYPNSSGTITTLNAYGTVDFTKDRRARTVSTLVLFPGCTVRYHGNITFTNITQLASPGTVTLIRV